MNLSFEVEFARPCPPRLFQGAARHGIRRRVVTRFTEDQVAFLTNCFESARRVRDKEAWRLMRADPRFKGVDDDNRPLSLSQAQIASWFSR